MKNKIAILIADAIALLVCYPTGYVLAEFLRHVFLLPVGSYGFQDAPPLRSMVYLLISAGVLLWLGLVCSHYTRRFSFWDQLRSILMAVTTAALFEAAVLYVIKLDFSRFAWLFTWVSIALGLPLSRLLVVKFLIAIKHWHRPTLIVGAGETALEAWDALSSDRFLGYQIAAICVPDGSLRASESVTSRAQQFNIPVVEGIEAINERIANDSDIQVIVALDAEETASVSAIVQQALIQDAQVTVIPPIRGIPLLGANPSFFFGHEVIVLGVRNNLGRRGARALKRLIDVVGSFLGLLMLMPFILILAAMVRSDGGPAFFGHTRIGRQGASFKCWKFRSMVANPAGILEAHLASNPEQKAEWEANQKLKNDPRVTPVGRFLRKTSLDELPQLLNVLYGEMSLVGPRPIVTDEIARYGDLFDLCFQARPGMTGIWQVSGRNETGYERRVALDAWYARNWTPWYDIVILLKTVPLVLGRRGAY